MTESYEWQAAFLAVSSLLGEPVDVAAASLDEAAAAALMTGGFGSASRRARAGAVAHCVASLVAELERLRLA